MNYTNKKAKELKLKIRQPLFMRGSPLLLKSRVVSRVIGGILKIINRFPEPLQSVLRDMFFFMIKRRIPGHGKFRRRIQHRMNIFWRSHDLENVRNTVMDSSDPIPKWKNVENWQRRLDNKHNGKEFARLNGCRVAETYWRGRDVSKIPFDKLPKQYVLKPTTGHSCHSIFLFNNSINLLNNQKYSHEALLEELQITLKENPHIEFIVEEFLRTEQGEYKIPVDYKFYMFDGTVAAVQVIERFSYQDSISGFYDENWNEIKQLFRSKNKPVERKFCRPAKLNEMIEYATKLSKAYEIFVRVDLYATEKGTVFGEFTPTPSEGNYFTPQADKMLSNYWEKYCKGKV